MGNLWAAERAGGDKRIPRVSSVRSLAWMNSHFLSEAWVVGGRLGGRAVFVTGSSVVQPVHLAHVAVEAGLVQRAVRANGTLVGMLVISVDSGVLPQLVTRQEALPALQTLLLAVIRVCPAVGYEIVPAEEGIPY